MKTVSPKYDLEVIRGPLSLVQSTRGVKGSVVTVDTDLSGGSFSTPFNNTISSLLREFRFLHTSPP